MKYEEQNEKEIMNLGEKIREIGDKIEALGIALSTQPNNVISPDGPKEGWKGQNLKGSNYGVNDKPIDFPWESINPQTYTTLINKLNSLIK